MGYSRWSSDDWSSYSSTTSTKTASAIFTSRGLHEDLNPKDVVVRESRDSDLNPQSNAIIVALDVTGSMGVLAENIVKTGLGVVFEEILTRKPVTDPHLMVMAIGDAEYDTAPLQVSQFESDLTITKQVEKIFVEAGGGGNNVESYTMPWYFAATRTSIDCWEKRGKKGVLITVGDENCPKSIRRPAFSTFLNESVEVDMSTEALYDLVSRTYDVYHIIIAQGGHARYHLPEVTKSWRDVIGQHAIVLDDYTKLAETIVSLLEVREGKDPDVVAASWSGDTSLVISKAVSGLTTTADPTAGTSVTRF